MKRIFSVVAVVMAMVVAIPQVNAQQDYKEFMKERKEMAKFTKEQLNERASKDARKEAKRLKKEGWQVAPGSLSLEKQLDRGFRLQLELDFETGFPKFIPGEGTATGTSYDAAKMQAINMAKIVLAGNIATEVEARATTNAKNNESIDPAKAVSAVTAVQAGQARIAQSLGRTITTLEVYREKGKMKEVRILLFYSGEAAKAAARAAIEAELDAEGDKLAEELDEILGW